VIKEHYGKIAHLKEMTNNIGTEINFVFGKAMKVQDIFGLFADETSLLKKSKKIPEYLRAMTLLLKGRFQKSEIVDNRKMEELIMTPDPKDIEKVQQELSLLKPLAEYRGIRVVMAKGSEIPNTVSEIGRLREINFRKAKEGSGNARDNDKYDEYYYHVIALGPNGEIYGSYRVGKGDEIMKAQGIEGFYNYELFDFNNLSHQELNQSLEMGRSFINYEAQPSKYTLKAIFTGIGGFLKENPNYRYLMGPVSISNSYSEISKKMMVDFLNTHYQSEMAAGVISRTPYQFNTTLNEEISLVVDKVTSLQELSRLVTVIDKQAAPTLITTYGKLGAEYLGFNLDAEFNTVDGMIRVDILKSLFEKAEK